MTIQEKIDFCIAQGVQQKKAQVYYRDDWDCYYFEIGGKFFALLSTKSEQGVFITLKNLPDINEELRATYEAIRPGYYTNKVHWNSIDLTTDEVSKEMLASMIEASYKLVFDKLPKKIQATLH